MSKKLKIEPRVTRLINYLGEIEDGKLQVPKFQRDYLWTKKQRKELFESIQKEFPIGSLLFWKPEDSFSIKEFIGPYKIKNQNNAEPFYILDGFQRMATLFGCLKNQNDTKFEVDAEEHKKFLIYYDLKNEEFTSIRGIPAEPYLLPVNILIETFEFLNFLERLKSEIQESNLLIKRAKTLASTILDYQLPTVQIIGGTIEDAVEIFSRVNSKGSPMSQDWMVSALTYNENKDFRLGTLIDELLNDLEIYNFQKLKRDVVFQCIRSAFGRLYFDEKIKDLTKRNNFAEVAKQTIESIKEAVKFLFEELLVLDLKLLPYGMQLIFLTIFFKEVKSPSKEQIDKLKIWFWKTTYANYFTIYTISKTRKAFKQFQMFMKDVDRNPTYNDNEGTLFDVSSFPDKIYLGSVRSKALVLFMLNSGNDFKNIETSKVLGFRTFYLFKQQNLKTSASAIPVVQNINSSFEEFKNAKVNDVSLVFENDDYEPFFSKYFLTKNMKENYKNGKHQEILNERKKLLIEAEKEFTTKKLGLNYLEH